MKKFACVLLCVALLAAISGCALTEGLSSFAYNGNTYYYSVFFDEEQATADARMATARIEAVALGDEKPQPVKADMIEDLFDGSGLTIEVDGESYVVDSLVTQFNKDGTFSKLDFGVPVPLDTPDDAVMLLVKNPPPEEGADGAGE